MIDMTGLIMRGFIAEPVITKWAGKLPNGVPNISANKTPSGVLPAIVLYEMKNRDGEFADDSPFTADIGYQISLFSKEGTHTLVQNQIDDIMRSLDFTRTNAYSAFDEDTQTHQRIMIYDTERSLDNE